MNLVVVVEEDGAAEAVEEEVVDLVAIISQVIIRTGWIIN